DLHETSNNCLKFSTNYRKGTNKEPVAGFRLKLFISEILNSSDVSLRNKRSTEYVVIDCSDEGYK
ncbi:hypothetical protein HHI36_000738, partial [Cryptolaemus montrouzieri]